MKNMTAFAPYCAAVSDEGIGRTLCVLTEWTVIARYLACRTATFVGYATYATNVSLAISLIVIHISGVPSPLSNSMP